MNTRTALILLAACLAACDTRPPSPAPSAGGGRGSARPEGEVGPKATPEPSPSPTPPTPPNPTPAPRRFQPSLHGFKFVNSFSGSPLPQSLRSLERVLGSTIPDRFGLCGGMSAAAADYFLADLPIPDAVTAPAKGEPLYTALYDRQVDSFGTAFAVPLRILQCMAAPDFGPPGLQAMTAKELPPIRERLAAGELVTLCLVLGKADGKTKPWDNHQVLAYADATTDPAAPLLRIYDPNFPGDDDATLAFTTTRHGLACTRSAHRRSSPEPSTTAVRGVFAGPYSKHTPTAPPAKK